MPEPAGPMRTAKRERASCSIAAVFSSRASASSCESVLSLPPEFVEHGVDQFAPGMRQIVHPACHSPPDGGRDHRLRGCVALEFKRRLTGNRLARRDDVSEELLISSSAHLRPPHISAPSPRAARVQRAKSAVGGYGLHWRRPAPADPRQGLERGVDRWRRSLPPAIQGRDRAHRIHRKDPAIENRE